MAGKYLSKEEYADFLDSSLTLLDKAIIFATKAHSGTTRKGTNVPYIVHPIEAAAIVSAMTDDEEIIAAAVLHDVIEDTDATCVDIERYFGLRIARLVSDESEDKRKDLPAADTWIIRKQETIDFLKFHASKDAKMLALADKLSNLRSIYRDVFIVGDQVWERFNQKDKAMHGWMYRAIADALIELKEHPTWLEYDRLVRNVFEKKR